jgi:hypothetical protein
MSKVVQFRRPLVSSEVADKLIRFGYLQYSQRQNQDAIERALKRLNDSCPRHDIVFEGDSA